MPIRQADEKIISSTYKAPGCLGAFSFISNCRSINPYQRGIRFMSKKSTDLLAKSNLRSNLWYVIAE
jgi:hypothetical protein